MISLVNQSNHAYLKVSSAVVSRSMMTVDLVIEQLAFMKHWLHRALGDGQLQCRSVDLFLWHYLGSESKSSVCLLTHTPLE